MSESGEKRKSPRIPVETELDVNIDAANLEATSVNISETGIRFDTPEPLEIDISFAIEGEERCHTGRLVWAKNKTDGGFTYGFEFIN